MIRPRTLRLIVSLSASIGVSVLSSAAPAGDPPTTQPTKAEAAVAPTKVEAPAPAATAAAPARALAAEAVEAIPLKAEPVQQRAIQTRRAEAMTVEIAAPAIRVAQPAGEPIQAAPVEAVAPAAAAKRAAAKPAPAMLVAQPAAVEMAAEPAEVEAVAAQDKAAETAARAAKDAAVREQAVRAAVVQRARAQAAPPVAIPAEAAAPPPPVLVKPGAAPVAPAPATKEAPPARDAKDAKDSKEEPKDPAKSDGKATSEFLEGATVRWQNLNRNASVQLDSGATTHNISLSGQVTFPAGAKILGFANETIVTEALDQDGNSMLQNRGDVVNAFKGRVARRNLYFQAVQMNNGTPMGYANVNLNQTTGKPTRIKTLTGYCIATIAGKTETKVVEAKIVKEYTKLTDGAEYKIDQYQVQNEQYANVTVSIRKPGNANEGYAGMMQPPVVAKLELVDDQGNAVNTQYLNMNYQGGSNNQIMVSYQANFQSTEPGVLANAKTIRITLATEVLEKKIPFELKDIPLP